MRILVIGATGLIGSAIVTSLQGRHDVVSASRSGDVSVDITDRKSIEAMYRNVGPVDGIVCAAGDAAFAPFAQLTDQDFDLSLTSKLMGQVNVVRLGLDVLRDGGSFTLTSGVLAQQPMPGSAAVSLVNAAIEGFARAAALELARGCRINVVSPGWVSETLKAMGQDPSRGTPAQEVAKAYVSSVEGTQSGDVISP